MKHPYHLVDLSPWPFLMGVGAFVLTSGIVLSLHGFGEVCLSLALLGLALLLFFWWRDVIREATYEGDHTLEVQRGLRIGFLLFILSEVLLFFSLFWAFFHSALSPSSELGVLWPPKGIESLDPFQLPLLNTLILLSSGATLTWAHHGLITGATAQVRLGLGATILLGAIFSGIQLFEYWEAGFTLADGVYGSTFYGATGLHGFHVLVGTLFLLVCLVRVGSFHFTRGHHFGFEAATWYWHFVDVVWLFLYLSIYYWGS